MQRKVSLSQIKRLISSCLTEKLSNISSVLEPNLRRIRLCSTPFWSVKSTFTSHPALSELISLSAFCSPEICNAVKRECDRMRKGGLSGAVVPGDAVNVTERKAYRLLWLRKPEREISLMLISVICSIGFSPYSQGKAFCSFNFVMPSGVSVLLISVSISPYVCISRRIIVVFHNSSPELAYNKPAAVFIRHDFCADNIKYRIPQLYQTGKELR